MRYWTVDLGAQDLFWNLKWLMTPGVKLVAIEDISGTEGAPRCRLILEAMHENDGEAQ